MQNQLLDDFISISVFFYCSGATHSTLIIANGNGDVVAKVNGDGTNHWMVGIPEVGRRIAAMASEAKRSANIPDSVKLKCIGLSLSGCEQDSTNALLEEEIRKEFPDLAEKYVVCSDTLGSILTVSNLGGVVIIAGTGSNAFLRNPNGGKSNSDRRFQDISQKIIFFRNFPMRRVGSCDRRRRRCLVDFLSSR